jgi:hypothetical protein
MIQTANSQQDKVLLDFQGMDQEPWKPLIRASVITG